MINLSTEPDQAQAAVRAAEARVENVTDSLARIGHSELLEARFRAEETKLLDARQALTQALATVRPTPPPRDYSRRAVLAVLGHIGEAAIAMPQKAKALLQGVVEAILMQPQPDGYAVRVSLKTTNPALLAEGGVGDSQRSCGGERDSSCITAIHIAKRLHYQRGPRAA